MDAASESPPEPGASEGKGRAGRNLPLAIVSGVLLAVAFLGTLVWDPYAFLAFVGALVVIALLELDVAFRASGIRPATPVAVGAGLVMLFGAYAVGPVAQTLGLVLLVAGTVAWTLLGTHPRRVAATLGTTIFMAVWVPFLASFIALLVARPEGIWYVMATVALTVSSDIGAYGFGSAFGRHKLAPNVSPGKTWEGLGGAFVTVLIVAALITQHLPGFGLGTALALGAVVVPAATLGDLAESLVKRELGLKDLGRIVPGHGGIMDRVDAIIFALPAAHLLLLALGT